MRRKTVPWQPAHMDAAEPPNRRSSAHRDRTRESLIEAGIVQRHRARPCQPVVDRERGQGHTQPTRVGRARHDVSGYAHGANEAHVAGLGR